MTKEIIFSLFSILCFVSGLYIGGSIGEIKAYEHLRDLLQTLAERNHE